MPTLKHLHERGWSADELAHYAHHTAIAAERTRVSQRIVAWLSVLLLACGTLFFSRLFFPVLVLVPVLLANLTVAFIAGCFAVLFGHVVRTLDGLSHGHHALIVLVAALTAILSSWFVVAQSIRLGVLFAVTFGILYSYSWYTWYERNKPA